VETGEYVITDELSDRMAERCILNDDDFGAVVLDLRPKRIQTVDLDHLALASKSKDFAKTIDEAHLITSGHGPIISLMRSRGIDPARGSGSGSIERMLAGRQSQGNAVMPGELGTRV
jgi:N-acetylglucosaminyldiphosphoundecaprenol N-acetyl-beta-D-mannosaminyltransferase